MKAVFADTFYFLALLNERDAAHKEAVAASRIPGIGFGFIQCRERVEALKGRGARHS
jgi:hypothetical protein